MLFISEPNGPFAGVQIMSEVLQTLENEEKEIIQEIFLNQRSIIQIAKDQERDPRDIAKTYLKGLHKIEDRIEDAKCSASRMCYCFYREGFVCISRPQCC